MLGILPVILGGLAVTSSWLFSRIAYKEAAGYVAILTSVSTSLMRSSIDLYASLVGASLIFLTLALYLGYRAKKIRALLISVQILLGILLLSYWLLWFFLLAIIVGAELLTSGLRSRIKNVFSVFFPSICLIVFFTVVALNNSPSAYWGFGSFFASALGKPYPFVSSANPLALGGPTFGLSNIGLLVGEGSIAIPLLAVAGMILQRPTSYGLKTLYIWAILAVCGTSLSSIGAHAALLFPSSVLAGVGLVNILRLLRK
jgi:hypothetical protein